MEIPFGTTLLADIELADGIFGLRKHLSGQYLWNLLKLPVRYMHMRIRSSCALDIGTRKNNPQGQVERDWWFSIY